MRSFIVLLVAVAAVAFTRFSSLANPSPSPSPSPTPTPSPSPAVAYHAILSGTLAFTSGVNAVGSFDSPTGMDRPTRANVSNAFAIVTKSSGILQYGLQTGVYSIPVVGFAGNKTIQRGANTNLFGPVPLAYLECAPSSNFNVSAGVLATLIGAESTFTYQDWNIQRGAVWNVENAVSRGFRASMSSGKLTATLGANDGFYSGHFGAAEGSLLWVPDASDSLLFVTLIPNVRTPANATASVANKALYNLVYTRTRGNLQLAPYLLYAQSPAAQSLSYTRTESAFGAAVLADLALGGPWSVAARVETLQNSSSATDTSANADLVGYGAGSGANTITVTPTWKHGQTFARVDFSEAHVIDSAPGLAFGASGNSRDQFRAVLEVGVQI